MAPKTQLRASDAALPAHAELLCDMVVTALADSPVPGKPGQDGIEEFFGPDPDGELSQDGFEDGIWSISSAGVSDYPCLCVASGLAFTSGWVARVEAAGRKTEMLAALDSTDVLHVIPQSKWGDEGPPPRLMAWRRPVVPGGQGGAFGGGRW